MLLQDEIIKVFRQSPFVYFFQFSACLIILCGAFFFMIPLFRFGWWGKFIFWFLIGLSVLYGLINLIKYSNTKLVIGQRQLVIFLQKGALTQQIIKIGYGKIVNINVFFKGLFAIIFHLGTIEFSLADGDRLLFWGLSQAEYVQELILKLQAEQRLNEERFARDLTQYQMIELARSLRQKLGKDLFLQIAEEDNDS